MASATEQSTEDGQAPKPAADRAHTHIRDGILGGRISPGTMLSENSLAAALSMSRTPIRAALARLQDEGWVTIYPQRGALVRELTEREVRESADVRHALESAGVQRGSATRREQLANLLGDNIDQQARAFERQDFAAFTTLAMRFHRTFVEMADNSVMLSIYDRLQDVQQLSILRSSQRITGEPVQVVDEHRALVEDARQGDWNAFAIHLGEHHAHSHGFDTALRPTDTAGEPTTRPAAH